MDKNKFTAFIGSMFNDSISIYCKPKNLTVNSIQRTYNKKSRLNFTLIQNEVTISTNGTQVQDEGYIVLLHVNNFTADDFGNYTLNISNSIGSSEWNFVLEAHSKYVFTF